MNGGKCGRCRGRGYVKPTIGFGDQQCPACKGNGVTERKSTLGSRTVSIPLPPGARCIVCNEPAIAQHHIVAQQRLERELAPEFRQDAKRDARNAVPTCYACHGALDVGDTEHPLPAGFWTFVLEYDLDYALPRWLSERVA